MNYARSENGVVVHVLRVDPSTVWGADRAKEYRVAPSEVKEGWLDNGEDYSPPPEKPLAIPEAVEAWQAKKALIASGHYTLVESAINALGDDPESLSVKVDWASAKTFRRDWPALVALSTQLKMDSGDLDALFVHAATL